jgi:hypothetical protein
MTTRSPPRPDVDEVQKLGAGAGVVAEAAEHLRGDHADAALVDAARGHAFMAALDDHADATGLQHLLDAARDLRGHLFLHLEAPRIGLDHAGKLADTDHGAVRQVADVHLADDRRHVMFAVAFVGNVAQHDHLVVAGHFLEGALEVFLGIERIAAEPVAIGVDDAPRRVEQSFARWIFAGIPQQHAYRVFGLCAADRVLVLTHGRLRELPRDANRHDAAL